MNETGDPLAGFATAILLSCSTFNLIQGNLVDRQPAPSSHFNGIALDDSARNTIRANTVLHQPAGGIVLFLGAVENRIHANRAADNTPWDAEDDNPSCDANVWKANEFGTTNQGCIR